MNSSYENISSRSETFASYECMRRRGDRGVSGGYDSPFDTSDRSLCARGSGVNRVEDNRMQQGQASYCPDGGEDVENMMEDPRGGHNSYCDQLDHDDLPACVYAGVSNSAGGGGGGRMEMSSSSGAHHGAEGNNTPMQYQAAVSGKKRHMVAF